MKGEIAPDNHCEDPDKPALLIHNTSVKGKAIQKEICNADFFLGEGWATPQNPYPEKRSNGQYLLGRFHFPLATCGKPRALLLPTPPATAPVPF